MKTLLYFFHLIAINLKSSMSLRGAFLARLIFMTVNNLLMFAIWLIFFDRFQSLGGWQFEHMAVMYGIGVFSFGFFVLGLHGLMSLPYLIDEGGVDLYMTQPKPIVLGLSGRDSDASGMGEILSGFILFYAGWSEISAHLHWLILFVLLGIIFWFSIALIFGSLSFWFKEMRELTHDLIMSIIVLSTQPASIYTGYTKWIVFTVMPVAYISYLPIQFFIQNKIEFLLGSAIGIFVLFFMSLWFFQRGLKNYESGNRFGVQG